MTDPKDGSAKLPPDIEAALRDSSDDCLAAIDAFENYHLQIADLPSHEERAKVIAESFRPLVTGMQEEIRRLLAVVEKYPTTRDGVLIHVGMDVWARDGVGGVGRERVDHFYRDDGGHWILNKYLSLPLAACCAYSTRSAALSGAAAAAEGQ